MLDDVGAHDDPPLTLYSYEVIADPLLSAGALHVNVFDNPVPDLLKDCGALGVFAAVPVTCPVAELVYPDLLATTDTVEEAPAVKPVTVIVAPDLDAVPDDAVTL